MYGNNRDFLVERLGGIGYTLIGFLLVGFQAERFQRIQERFQGRPGRGKWPLRKEG